MIDNDDFIDLEEALRLLGVSRPTLYRWLRDGHVPAYRTGRQWRFSRQELVNFVKGQKSAPSQALEHDLREALEFFRRRRR